MKVAAIGDIHGKTIWKDFVEKVQDNSDKIVFIGDYFDCFENISHSDQISNFKNIVKLKTDNPDKFEILLGNHDYHYLKGVRERYSGFMSYAKFDISEVLDPLVQIGTIKILFEADGVIYTHAGITKTWWKNNNIKNLEELNGFIIEEPERFKFVGYDGYGDSKESGPLWVRPYSLMHDKIDGYKFVVGHTRYDHGIDIDERFDIAFIDCLDGRRQYLPIIDGEFMKPEIF